MVITLEQDSAIDAKLKPHIWHRLEHRRKAEQQPRTKRSQPRIHGCVEADEAGDDCGAHQQRRLEITGGNQRSQSGKDRSRSGSDPNDAFSSHASHAAQRANDGASSTEACVAISRSPPSTSAQITTARAMQTHR